MRKIAVLAALALVVPAMAGVLTAEPVGKLAGGHVLGSGARDSYLVYDNTVYPSGYGFSQNPGAWIGDDLQLDYQTAPEGYRTLNSVSWTVWNASTAGPLNTCDVQLTFWSLYDGTPLGTITFQGLDPYLPSYYYTIYTATDLCSLGIVLPEDGWIGVAARIYNLTGGATKAGQILYNPPILGSSADMFYLDNTVATPPGTNQGWYWFGGNPVANFLWAIEVCPEPASLALLALGGLMLIRRR